MRLPAALALAGLCSLAFANEQEIQRALVQRDQQSAEFAARVRGADVSRIQELHARQLQEVGRAVHLDPEVARQLRPYERQRMADERELRFGPPVVLVRKPEAPLPLPGGPGHGVDPIPAQGLGH